MTFEKELERLLNSHSKENESDTPDFILAQYLLGCLKAFVYATNHRDQWWNHKHWENKGDLTHD